MIFVHQRLQTLSTVGIGVEKALKLLNKPFGASVEDKLSILMSTWRVGEDTLPKVHSTNYSTIYDRLMSMKVRE